MLLAGNGNYLHQRVLEILDEKLRGVSSTWEGSKPLLRIIYMDNIPSQVRWDYDLQDFDPYARPITDALRNVNAKVRQDYLSNYFWLKRTKSQLQAG